MRSKRLQKAQQRINRFPYRYEAIDDAYARFLEDGTLPEDNSLAGRVLQRVLDARKKVPEVEAERLALNLHQPAGTTREMLFREACCRVKEVRAFARVLLTFMVRDGYDPTDPESIGPEMEPWDFIPVCMRLIGWPHEYVRPQHRDQLERLLKRQGQERAVRPRNDDTWDREAARALATFLKRGVLPTDARYLAYVLTVSEHFALFEHTLRGAPEDLLAAFDALANTCDGERAAALLRVCELQARHHEEGKHARS